ncbi:hypothetical protein BDR05DRAFT_78235 [Suillus weaverae]|nr:hypothetical protein BDR05DRAFT_78235 [Suillus weaverae]
MTINFQRNPLQWDIYVKRDEGIRVRDVFEAIYSAFDIPLTPHEKSLIPLRLRAGCEEAFRHRCNLAPVLPIVQQRQGWKRVDALLHETLFRGLTQSKSGGDWTLNLSRTMLRGKQDSNIMNRGRLMPDSIALRYWKDLMLAAPIARHWFKNLFGDALIPVLETTASYPPLPQPSSLIEYLPPYPNQNPDVLLNFSNNDLFSLPLSAAFAPRTGVDSDIMLPLRSACRICNFARLSAILQHRTLCNLLNNISPLIPEPSSQDYTWVFFCKFVPLCALFDSPGRGPLPIIQLSSDRARLIERLEVDFENPKNAMSWFHGPSGTGKSVIAYTLASRCRQKNRLAGSFFFSRRHADRRNARSLVFALAYQLGLSQPQAKEKIISTLHRDPGIISPSRDLREQFARLLIEPLEAVDWRSPSRVFVIDAIDQCQDHVPELISLLTRLLSHLVDVGLHIFFTSRDRVGVPIQRHLLPIISDIALNSTGITGDVRLFLRQSFDKIHRRHRLQCRKPWPPNEVLDRLADRVGPHFITGSVIVKFVDSPDHDPIDRMDLIYHLPLNPSSPPELSVDNFYKYIISTADDLDQAYLYLTIVANVVGMLSCSQLDSLLKRGPNQTFDMRFVLSQLSPLVHIPDGNDSVVQVCHESLCDFLFDPLRCGKQFIPEAVVHRLLAYSSLSIMTEELPNDSALCSRLSRLATESSSASLGAFDDGDVLCFAAFSPPEPLLFLSTLWHIMRHRYTGLTADSRTKLALGYFCCIWQILQHISLSTVLSTIDTLPAFRFLANIQSLPVLLAFPIFLAFESPRSGQTLSPSTLEYDHRIETLDAVAEIVADVHALKYRCRSDSGALDYACTHWVYHLSLAEWDDELRSILITFMRQKLQQWLVKAWCLQDFETCLRTLCEVRELCLTANPPIHFDFDAQRTTADMKAEEDEEKPGLVRRSIKDVVDDVDVEVEVEVEQAGVARRSIKEALEAVQLEGAEHIKRTAQAGMKRVDEAIMAGQDWLQTDDGKEWLWTEGGRDWLKTTTGQDWLGTTTGQDRLDTMAGRDWLKTTTGQDRLDTMAGRDWLNTTTGKDWSNTTAGRDWLNRDRALSVIFHPDKQRGERTKDTAETEVERKVAENDPYETAISEQDSAKTLVSPSLFTTSQLRRKDEQVDLSHGVSTGRGGCWTCRLRRKKCDERREDNSCLTCKRLRIDCLGWGTRRPPWMRDKKAVEDYKASIKAQLIRASLIRGQPLSIVQASAVASSSTSASSSSAFASRQFQGSASSSRPSQINDLGIPTPADSLCDPTVTPMFDLIPKLHLHNIYVPPNPPISPAGSLTFHSSPMVEMCFNPDFDAATKTLYNPLTPSMLDDGLPKGHIFYYFEHIRKLQYVFAGNSVANITYSLVLQHPQGPVANAISALASLHFSLKRIALGFEVPNPTLENSPAIRFYNTAHQQIYRNKRTMLSESDANAAIHMLNFSPLSGGVTDWRPMLDIASEWLVKTGITMCDDPKLMMIKMNEASQLALKATMWCDIMSTLTLQTTPKHLSFYRRLFRAVAGNWDLAQQGIGNESTLRMDNFTGCPYEILLGIAEISTLSCWKMQELRKESLSSRELIRRGDVIERHLRTQTEMVPSVEADQPLHPDLSSIGADSPTEHAGASTPADDTRRIVAQVFLEAAILYLHTVLNDSNPGVPEIMDSVVAMVQLLNRLPASNIDRCLVFPICLAGCLTDDRITREFMKARLLAQHDGLGNINQTLRVMETAWQRRDDRGGAVEWQDLLNIQRLLLV